MSIEAALKENTESNAALTAAIAALIATFKATPVVASVAGTTTTTPAAEPAQTPAAAAETTKRAPGRPRKALETGPAVTKNSIGDPVGTMYHFVASTDSLFKVEPQEPAITVPDSVVIDADTYAAHKARIAAKMVALQTATVAAFTPEPTRYFQLGADVFSIAPGGQVAPGAVEISAEQFAALQKDQAARVAAAVTPAVVAPAPDVFASMFDEPAAPAPVVLAVPAPEPITYRYLADQMMRISGVTGKTGTAGRDALFATLKEFGAERGPDLQKDANPDAEGKSLKYGKVLAFAEAALAKGV